ncbi:DUF1007 family protein [Loktanella sp. TSTF-M6]|uniref:DUF1007 family protein n=1 Tax=Loktanella gaetbuli TaxID=2881335 RepID=A0ABS8BWY4_9RHOB|nr:DUF1007 family protein [Loktanella gaetbuli]MCB5200261.1 DUF1007 family protein [Loktanella gaetbuli]
MRPRLFATAVACCFPTVSAVAHPHVFVTASVTVVYTDGVPTAVELSWLYDDYFSLLLTSDLGIDLDGDLVLTPQEEAILAQAVTEWPADFNGDLEVMQNDDVVRLLPKQDHRMVFENGLVREVHTRPLDPGLTGDPLTVRVYDPYYYVAYDLLEPVNITGTDQCSSAVTPPDLHNAYALVEELLYGRPASDVGPDEEFPAVGVEFAATITITCET